MMPETPRIAGSVSLSEQADIFRRGAKGLVADCHFAVPSRHVRAEHPQDEDARCRVPALRREPGKLGGELLPGRKGHAPRDHPVSIVVKLQIERGGSIIRAGVRIFDRANMGHTEHGPRHPLIVEEEDLVLWGISLREPDPNVTLRRIAATRDRGLDRLVSRMGWKPLDPMVVPISERGMERDEGRRLAKRGHGNHGHRYGRSRQ